MCFISASLTFGPYNWEKKPITGVRVKSLTGGPVAGEKKRDDVDFGSTTGTFKYRELGKYVGEVISTHTTGKEERPALS